MPTDIRLDTSTHDIDLSRGGQLLTTNKEALGQRMKVALLLRRGEWFPDTVKGVPYHFSFFNVKGNKGFIDAFFQNYILDLEGVDAIVNYSSTINIDRVLEVDVTVRTSAGIIQNYIIEV